MRLDAFGRRLRAFRKLKQMTQADLARALGVSLATIGGIERGTRQPTAHLVRAIASALSVDVEELCGRDWPGDGWDRGAAEDAADSRAGHAAWDEAGLAPAGCAAWDAGLEPAARAGDSDADHEPAVHASACHEGANAEDPHGPRVSLDQGAMVR